MLFIYLFVFFLSYDEQKIRLTEQNLLSLCQTIDYLTVT